MTLKTRLQIDYYVGGALHMLIKPIVVLLGATLRRDHDLDSVRDITILKLLGGGSLVIAYPSLLSLKQRSNPGKLRLVTLPSTKPFAELLGIFDEIVVVNDQSLFTILADAARTIIRLQRSDAIIDLEVHSRLSTIFCLLTCARNRVGFYTRESYWRRSLATHLLFFNPGSPVHCFYEQVAELFGATLISFDKARSQFRRTLAGSAAEYSERAQAGVFAIAPCCSNLSRERMMSNKEWVRILSNQMRGGPPPIRIDLLGGAADHAELESLRLALQEVAPTAAIVNHAGQTSLMQSVLILCAAQELFAIDSALLHIAELLGIHCTSFWGPTSPQILLQLPGSDLHTIRYAKLPCSPCVHVSSTPPCHGNNLCMRLAADPDAQVDLNPLWLAQRIQED